MIPTPVCEKLSDIVNHACNNIPEKINLFDVCGAQIRLCLFTFRPIVNIT